MMSEKELQDFGLMKGDRLKLMAFCASKQDSSTGSTSNPNVDQSNDERTQKINKIKELLDQGKRKRFTGSGVRGEEPDQEPKFKENKKNKTSMRFEVGWKHWNSQKMTHVLKKKSTGGGTRVISLERDLSKEECIELFKNMFYPQGQSSAGTAKDMNFDLANFQGEKITVLSDGEPFTPGRYRQLTGFSSPRLYLLSRPKPLFFDPSDDSSDEELEKSPFIDQYPTSPQIAVDGDINDGLIGTSEERNTLKNIMDKDFQESLKADQEKAQEAKARQEQEQEVKREEDQRVEDAKRIISARLSRVPEQPKADESKVDVVVKHCSGETLRRSFKTVEKVSAVYDWVGSTHSEPLNFSLNKWPNEILYPDNPIAMASASEAGRLFMAAQKQPVPLSSDEHDIFWFGGMVPAESYDETVCDISDDDFEMPTTRFRNANNMAVDPLLPQAPQQLMEDDEDKLSYFDSLEQKRSKAFLNLSKSPIKIVSVSRENILEDVMGIYKEKDIMSRPVVGTFKNESASGDGVLRDIYSEFWDSFTSRYCEGSTQFCLQVDPSLTEEDYIAIGHIITHQYLLTGTFPVNICEAQIQKIISENDKEIDDDCLLRSFKGILTEKEQYLIDQGLQNASPFPQSELLDILSDYRVNKCPTPDNLRHLLIEVAKHELIAKSYLAITLVKKGMGDFWGIVLKEEIQSIYEMCIPSKCNITSCIHYTCSNQTEDVVSRWLTRYLEHQSSTKLSRFLQFCTGSGSLLPGKEIYVRFESMSDAMMRPKARTCFRSLILPSNIRSFANLTSMLDKCLQDITMWGLRD